jgi:tetratricopeptide (TPR) repeat protein/predicted Ser/Thr protein kinase
MNALVEQVFHEVANLSQEERLRYFHQNPIDPTVRREVESLLAFDQDATRQLAGEILQSAAHLLESGSTRCGPWQLNRMIGSGGMGAVYLANREDGEVRQQAAVKLIQSGCTNLRERFLRERQILASLNHRYIARLMDAGHQAGGRPFLVMEYVDGVAIDTYAAKLPVIQRVRLFLKVCEAVSYAHRQLVIHRDVKPSNILISEAGEPKLLDFGIAKMLDETDPNQTVERFLTPGYSSPEQVQGGAIGTASDIYSLGAVLYRLLTGLSPHDPASAGNTATNGAGSWEKRILEQEPKAPSAFHREVPRDLDFIVLKALRKDPVERYSSVDQFADDLNALLQSRPVRARAAGSWYRTRKFMRRNWMMLSASAVVAIGLAVGLLALNRERSLAQWRFTQVRELANKLFDIDAEVRRTPGTTGARQMIVNTSLQYLERLAPDAHRDPELALEIGNAYMRVARVQGVPIGSTLGQLDQAENSLKKADALVEPVLVAQPWNRVALLRSAQINHDRHIVAGLSRRNDDTLRFAKQAVVRLDRFVDARKPDRAEAQVVVICYQNVAIQLTRLLHLDDAIRHCRRAVDIARDAALQEYAGAALSVLSNPLRMQGRLDEALAAIDEADRSLAVPAGEPNLGRSINHIAALSRKGVILGGTEMLSLGRTKEAAEVLERAFQMAKEIVKRDPNEATSRSRLALAGTELGNVLTETDPSRALAVYDHVLVRLAEVKKNAKARRDEVNALASSTYALRKLGRNAEARQRLNRAFELLRQMKAYPAQEIEPASEVDRAVRALADLEAATGKLERSSELYRELIDGVLAATPMAASLLPNAVYLSRRYTTLEGLYRRAGKSADAAALVARQRELWQHWEQKLPDHPVVRRELSAIR